MSKYYTDEEIIEFVQNIGDSKESYEWVAYLVSERFGQKDNVANHLRTRIETAANLIGHNTINEMMYE